LGAKTQNHDQTKGPFSFWCSEEGSADVPRTFTVASSAFLPSDVSIGM
jgi:hypothetical protein